MIIFGLIIWFIYFLGKDIIIENKDTKADDEVVIEPEKEEAKEGNEDSEDSKEEEGRMKDQ